MFITHLGEKIIPLQGVDNLVEIRLCFVYYGHSLRQAKLTLGKSCLKKPNVQALLLLVPWKRNCKFAIAAG